MTGGAIGLAMCVMAVTSSLFFVGQKLLQTSTSVEGMAFLGAYASAVLAFLAVAVYVPLNTWIAVKLGGLLEKLNVASSPLDAATLKLRLRNVVSSAR